MAVAGLHQRRAYTTRLTGGGWHMLTVSSHMQSASQPADRLDSPLPHQHQCEGTQLGAFNASNDMAWHNHQFTEQLMSINARAQCSSLAHCRASLSMARRSTRLDTPAWHRSQLLYITMRKSGMILTDELVSVVNPR